LRQESNHKHEPATASERPATEKVRRFEMPRGLTEHYGEDGGLPGGLRRKMEKSFGADFSDVRVREGGHVSAPAPRRTRRAPRSTSRPAATIR
jgi:hypothetical protein